MNVTGQAVFWGSVVVVVVASLPKFDLVPRRGIAERKNKEAGIMARETVDINMHEIRSRLRAKNIQWISMLGNVLRSARAED